MAEVSSLPILDTPARGRKRAASQLASDINKTPSKRHTATAKSTPSDERYTTPARKTVSTRRTRLAIAPVAPSPVVSAQSVQTPTPAKRSGRRTVSAVSAMSPTASVARAMQFDDLIDSKPDAPLPVPDEFVEQALSSVEPEPQLEVQPSIETQVATSTIELEDSAFVADVVVPAEAVRLHSWQQTNCAALQEIVSFCGVMVPRLAFSYLASFHDSTKDFAELKPQNPANTAIQMTQHASSVVIKQDTASTDVSDAVLARRERLLAGLNRNSQPVASSSSFASMAKSMSNRSARLSNAALSMQSNQSSVLSPKPEQSILNESKVDFMRDLAHSNAAQRTKLRLPLKHQDLLECFRAVERTFLVLKMRRREFAPFADLKLEVERTSRRRFETTHLAQLLSVFPEGYEIVAIKNDRAAKLDSISVRSRPDNEFGIALTDFGTKNDLSDTLVPLSDSAHQPLVMESQPNLPPGLGRELIFTSRLLHTTLVRYQSFITAESHLDSATTHLLFDLHTIKVWDPKFDSSFLDQFVDTIPLALLLAPAPDPTAAPVVQTKSATLQSALQQIFSQSAVKPVPESVINHTSEAAPIKTTQSSSRANTVGRSLLSPEILSQFRAKQTENEREKSLQIRERRQKALDIRESQTLLTLIHSMFTAQCRTSMPFDSDFMPKLKERLPQLSPTRIHHLLSILLNVCGCYCTKDVVGNNLQRFLIRPPQITTARQLLNDASTSMRNELNSLGFEI